MPESQQKNPPLEPVLARLFRTRRWCYFIAVDCFVEGMGYRVSIVFENEPGHYPTGTWPYTGKADEKKPWFWGPTYDEARLHAEDENEKLGVSKLDYVKIVASSMARQQGEVRDAR